MIRRSPRWAEIKTIPAMQSLVKRGLTLMRAKRAIEESLEADHVVIALPNVESEDLLALELAQSGFLTSVLRADPIDLKRLRERLGLSQEQFADRFCLGIDSVQNWESGRRQPDRATRSFLKVIESLSDQVTAALEMPLA